MARVRSPDRDKAFEIYKEYKGNIDLVKIAELLDIPAGTIRGWKNKDKWNNKLNGTFQKDNKKNTERSNKKNKTKNKPIAEEVKEGLENTELTDKQRLFCIYYIKYRNKTKAYMKAYKCSWENANAHAYELWENVGVRKEIDRQLKELRDNIKIDIQDLIQLNIDIAFSDISDFVTFGQRELPVLNSVTGEQIINDDGQAATYTVNYVDFKESNTVDGTIISEISKGKNGVKIKLQDKMKAVDFLKKHIEFLDEDNKRKLDIENKKLQNEKLRADIAASNKETLDNELKIVIDYGDENGNS